MLQGNFLVYFTMLWTYEVFFYYMYKVKFETCTILQIESYQMEVMKCHIKSMYFPMCDAMAINIAHQMYYVDVIDANEWNSNQLESLNTKVMEVYCKEHIIMFHKCLFMCNPTLEIKFLHHVQMHRNMNSKPKMLRKAPNVGFYFC